MLERDCLRGSSCLLIKFWDNYALLQQNKVSSFKKPIFTRFCWWKIFFRQWLPNSNAARPFWSEANTNTLHSMDLICTNWCQNRATNTQTVSHNRDWIWHKLISTMCSLCLPLLLCLCLCSSVKLEVWFHLNSSFVLNIDPRNHFISRDTKLAMLIITIIAIHHHSDRDLKDAQKLNLLTFICVFSWLRIAPPSIQNTCTGQGLWPRIHPATPLLPWYLCILKKKLHHQSSWYLKYRIHRGWPRSRAQQLPLLPNGWITNRSHETSTFQRLALDNLQR